MHNALSSIDNDFKVFASYGSCHWNNFVKRVNNPERIWHLCKGKYLGSLGDKAFQLVCLQLSVVINRNYFDDKTAFCGGYLPRNNVWVVFTLGKQDFVSLFHRLSESFGKQVQAFGSTSCVDNLATLVCTQIISHFGSHILKHIGRPLAQSMHTSMNVGIVMKIIIAHCLNHTTRFLCCCRIIKIYQWFSVHFFFQNGKLFPQSCQIHHLFQDFIVL